MQSKSAGQKILHFPLTKIIIGIVVVVGLVVLTQMGANTLFDSLSLERNIRRLLIGIMTAALSIIGYTLLYKVYEKREITELSLSGIGRNLFTGFLLGSVLQSLTILVIYSMGGFSVVSVNPILFLLPALTMAFTSAIFEEILVRGIIFRIMEEKLGSYIALIISALIFGAMHLANPNSSLLAATGLALQAGLFLAAAFMFSRNLWFPIAIHFAWNFTQAGIYGAAVSGNATNKSLFTTKIEGAEWYTGGAFGPEGSIQATLFCLTATIILLMICHKQNKIIKPIWKKEPVATVDGFVNITS